MSVNVERFRPQEGEARDALCLRLAARFIDQVIANEDPDAVDAFLRWRDDPRIGSLLELAAHLDDDRLDQLLFAAEDLFSEMEPEPKPNPSPLR